MQAQAWQVFELGARPLHACGHEAFCHGQHRIRITLGAYAPKQAFGLEARTAAIGAFGVAAVLGQKHANVHLVGLGLQVLKEPFDPEPVLVPLAIPVR